MEGEREAAEEIHLRGTIDHELSDPGEAEIARRSDSLTRQERNSTRDSTPRLTTGVEVDIITRRFLCLVLLKVIEAAVNSSAPYS